VGHSRPGPAGGHSSNVRYAPKATFGHQNAIGRDRPKADQVQCSKKSGLHAYQINVKAKTLARQYLPDRKRSADIIDCCAEYTEREATANEREQHGRFHAVDRLLVDV
jgi:hypothetical protein